MLFWWNTNPAVYYANSPASYHFSPFVAKLATDDPNEIHRHLKNIYQKAGSVLYQFSSQPLNQEAIDYDFLGHIREATIRMPNEPPGKPNIAYRMLTAIGAEFSLFITRFSTFGSGV